MRETVAHAVFWAGKGLEGRVIGKVHKVEYKDKWTAGVTELRRASGCVGVAALDDAAQGRLLWASGGNRTKKALTL